jgi:hypothetical protein
MLNNISTIKSHLRNREYMSGVERDIQRVRATGEVFTPTPLVQKILNSLPVDVFTDKTKTFLDPSCGDGQFLAEVIIRKIEHGSTYLEALTTSYGVDLMPDNCLECIRRLYMCNDTQIQEYNHDTFIDRDTSYCWSPGLRSIYWVNTPNYIGWAKIVCANALKYDYGFGQLVYMFNYKPKKKTNHTSVESKKKQTPNLELFKVDQLNS